ncbi:TolC family protein [uncultured Flavobacterium sp.]|uniref:TolC family protein n=1 Tax=uncultured Flavobacterium sp. TaxID=165435 RepID=UPI0025EBF78A|nr:TolC family protein [uncultured Flavobacterium sp.]
MKTISSLTKLKAVAFIFVASLFISENVQAQAQTLTLKDAIKYALENKADSKKAKLQVENSNYQIQEVRSRALPQITANGNMTYNPILQLNALPGDIFGAPGTTVLAPLGQEWTATGGVSLTQAIFDQAVFTGLKAAKTTREFYQINQQLTEEQVIERVANNYYQVFVQREKLAVVDSNYVNTSKVRDIIKGQFENGLAKKIDLDRLTVNLYNINTQRQQLINAVQLQENSLKFYMGMPIETPILIPDTEFEVTPQMLSEAPNTATRTEYLLLEKQEQLLTYQKKAIIAEYYPTLSLSGSYNYIGQGPEMPLGAKPADGVYWSDYSSIGLNLRIPIFTGFGTRARVRQADVDIRKNKEDMIDTKLSLDLAYENAKTQINNSLITIKNQGENVQLAQEVLDNTKNNYYNGLAPLTDLLDAENSHVEAQNNYTSALLDYKLAEIQLIKAKGELRTLTN